MSYAYECILHVISAYFHRPAIHIDYQITCNVYQCIMIFLFVSHQRPPIQFRPFIIKLSTTYIDRNSHFTCQHDHLLRFE